MFGLKRKKPEPVDRIYPHYFNSLTGVVSESWNDHRLSYANIQEAGFKLDAWDRQMKARIERLEGQLVTDAIKLKHVQKKKHNKCPGCGATEIRPDGKCAFCRTTRREPTPVPAGPTAAELLYEVERVMYRSIL